MAVTKVPKQQKVDLVGDMTQDMQTLIEDYNTTGMADAEKAVVARFLKMNDESLLDYVPDPNSATKGHNRISRSERDARLVLVQRLMIRGVTHQQMAEKLGVSPRMVTKLKVQVRERLKSEVGNMDFGAYAGETVCFYRELRGTAMIMAGTNNLTPRDKMTAMNTALRADEAMQNFFDKCGVFDAIKGNNTLSQSFNDTKLPDADRTHDVVADTMAEIAMNLKAAAKSAHKAKSAQQLLDGPSAHG